MLPVALAALAAFALLVALVLFVMRVSRGGFIAAAVGALLLTMAVVFGVIGQHRHDVCRDRTVYPSGRVVSAPCDDWSQLAGVYDPFR
jgi:polyferredoxin